MAERAAREGDRTSDRSHAREEILDRFRAEYPDLAAAMGLAGDAEAAWEAFDRARQPVVTYSMGSGTELR